MSAYIPSGKGHRQVNEGARQLSIVCTLSPPPEDVVLELVTVGGYDEHL
ncbi:MAG TPA: hypothetical protein VMA72_16015 [Streptosporangiaceae bacterium]|nr:hypothetical protein [Streptosporangiaceae bacterium]